MKVKFKVKEVRPRIFLAEFEDQYDLAMTFCRYQEFFESPNPKFRGKHFKMTDFMRWYSKNRAGYFSYPKDWGGFNLDSRTLLKCLEKVFEYGSENHRDLNDYDFVMEQIKWKCLEKMKAKTDHGYWSREYPEFYLIGAQKGNQRVLDHEIAHGTFFLNKEYRKEMLSLVKNLKAPFRKKIQDHLIKIGYTKQVLDDETQAYLSTGVPESFGIKLKGEQKPFEEVFRNFCEKKGK